MTDPIEPTAPSPSLDGATPPTAPGATQTPTPAPTPTPEPASTPEAPSPLPAEPTAEEIAAAEAATAAAAVEEARAAVHTDATAYAVNIDAEARAALGLAEADDPIVMGLSEVAAATGMSQGAMDDFLKTAAEMAKRGLFDTGFDPAAEAALLGENAAGRRREVEIFADALKSRGGDFDDGMHQELMSLSPTANGVKLVEYFRRLAGPAGEIAAPEQVGQTEKEAAVAKWREQRRDPRYETDRDFRRATEKLFEDAHR